MLYIALVVSSFAKRVAEPLETLVKSITGGSASRLDVLIALLVSYANGWCLNPTYPCALSQAVQTKLIGNLGGVHCVLCIVSVSASGTIDRVY